MVEVGGVSGSPGGDVAVGVFAEDGGFAGGVEGRGRGIRGDGSGPDELYVLVSRLHS